MEPVFHYLIPVLFLLAVFPKFCKSFGYKKIFLLGLLGVLPDFDVFTSMHRFLFHNIFFVILGGLVIYYLAGKIYGLLSFYFLGSHLLFDLNRFGVGLFWPFYKKFMGFEIGLVHYKGDGFKLIIDFFTESLKVGEGAVESWYLHPMGTLVLILFLILIVVKFYSPSNSTKV
jgi:hypothetical protein